MADLFWSLLVFGTLVALAALALEQARWLVGASRRLPWLVALIACGALFHLAGIANSHFCFFQITAHSQWPYSEVRFWPTLPLPLRQARCSTTRVALTRPGLSAAPL